MQRNFIRLNKKPYKCSKSLYLAFLLSTCIRFSAKALAEVTTHIKIAHDAINRWLKNKKFTPKGIWIKVKKLIKFDDEYFLIVDDTHINKYSSKKINLVSFQRSGTSNSSKKGIVLENFILCKEGKKDEKKQFIPIDYRIFDKKNDGKNKHVHFREMLTLAHKRGLKPKAIVMDSWYVSLDNIKYINKLGWIWVAPLKKNRIVNKNEKISEIDIPEEGLQVHLRGYGDVKVIKLVTKHGHINYLATNNLSLTSQEIIDIYEHRWSIEIYHRELKQSCGLERCQALSSRAQRNHIYLSIESWIYKNKWSLEGKITVYEQDWEKVKIPIDTKMNKILQNDLLA